MRALVHNCHRRVSTVRSSGCAIVITEMCFIARSQLSLDLMWIGFERRRGLGVFCATRSLGERVRNFCRGRSPFTTGVFELMSASGSLWQTLNVCMYCLGQSLRNWWKKSGKLQSFLVREPFLRQGRANLSLCFRSHPLFSKKTKLKKKSFTQNKSDYQKGQLVYK